MTLESLWRRWCAAGFDPEAFGRQTPRSFMVAMRGHEDRMERDAQDRRALAWMIAKLGRAAEMPGFVEWVAPDSAEAKAERRRETLRSFDAMDRALGGKKGGG